MYRLHVAVADLIPPEDCAGDPLPRLPRLESLLSRATVRPGPADWRSWALSCLGATVGGDTPALAALVAARHGLPVAGHSWLVLTPVHLVPGMTTVHYHVGGPVVLEPATVLDTAAALQAAFGEPGVRFVAAGSLLLLGMEGVLDLKTVDPGPLAGRELLHGRAQGVDARRLARLTGEWELWLHGRGVAGRDGRTVHGLHPWGHGTAIVEPASRSPQLLGSDPFLQAASGPTADTGHALEVWSLADLMGLGRPFAEADDRWAAPLAARLGDGEVTAADVYVRGRIYGLRAIQRWRFYRRVRPWWELCA